MRDWLSLYWSVEQNSASPKIRELEMTRCHQGDFDVFSLVTFLISDAS